MKLRLSILFVLTIVVAQFSFAAKEVYYGNIKLRSIGVGNMPQTTRTYQTTLPNNSNSTYMHYYGKRTDDQYYGAQNMQNYSAPRVNSNSYAANNAHANQPFNGGDAVQTGGAMYIPGSNPNNPGTTVDTPIGDAVPFMVLMALAYAGVVFVRRRG